MSQNLQYDVIIFGGGMVGSAVALGFAQRGHSVAIVEPNMPDVLQPSSPPDLRVSAISYGSQQLLNSLGAWQHIEDSRIQPYTQLAVWENAYFATEFDASDVELPYLGHLLENRNLQLALHKALAEYGNFSDHEKKISWFDSGQLRSSQAGQCLLSRDNGEQQFAEAKLVVAADGAFSTIRRAAKMGETGWQYKQNVFAIGIQTNDQSLQKTYQQFSKNGPMAYLPLFENYAALVWYTAPAFIQTLKSLSSSELKAQIIRYFPPLHSDFDVLDFASFPIRRNHANRYFRDKVVLCGDAAHTINPLAGQGVNIGFQDVEALFEIDLDKDLKEQLTVYENKRRPQNLMMMTAMDVFSHAFSNSNPVLKLGRNLGLKLAHHAGPFKNMALKRALGI